MREKQSFSVGIDRNEIRKKGGETVDMDTLINEICRRVQERVDALEHPAENCCEAASDKPKLLILTQGHGTICHEALENAELAECYQTECALLSEYRCRPEEYEAVIAFCMTNEALGKIAHGILDSGYTKLFAEFLLAGKKIFLAEEAVELFKSRATAPAPFYGCMEANLKLLTASGVIIAPAAQIPALILRGERTPDCVCAKEGSASEKQEPVLEKPKDCSAPEVIQKEASLTKRIITEKDMIALGNEKVTCVWIGEKAILSDLAKEYAAKHKMTVQRISSEKRG